MMSTGLPLDTAARSTSGFTPGALRDDGGMDVAVAIVATAFTLAGAVFLLGLFVWAARKDGEEDRALQRRLGIRRRTRLGR